MKGDAMRRSEARGTEPLRMIEKMVGNVLRIGVLLSAAIICMGLILLVAKGGIANGMKLDAAIPYPRSLRALLSGLLALDPASVMVLGLVTLIATPISRVVVSIIGFSVERDWRYVIVTALVLAVLILGMMLGKAA